MEIFILLIEKNMTDFHFEHNFLYFINVSELSFVRIYVFLAGNQLYDI